MAKKKGPARKPTASNDSDGAYGVAKAIESVAEELSHLVWFDDLKNNVGDLAGASHSLARAIAASVIAQHGSPEDRAKIVGHLKGWFWESDLFKD